MGSIIVHLLQHNFVRPHWTPGEVPAVRLGIIAAPLRLEDILMTKDSIIVDAPTSGKETSPAILFGKAALQ